MNLKKKLSIDKMIYLDNFIIIYLFKILFTNDVKNKNQGLVKEELDQTNCFNNH